MIVYSDIVCNWKRKHTLLSQIDAHDWWIIVSIWAWKIPINNWFFYDCCYENRYTDTIVATIIRVWMNIWLQRRIEQKKQRWALCVLNATVKYNSNSMTVVIFFCCIEYPSPWEGIDFAASVMTSTDCICSCEYNYHTTTTTFTIVLDTNQKSNTNMNRKQKAKKRERANFNPWSETMLSRKVWISCLVSGMLDNCATDDQLDGFHKNIYDILTFVGWLNFTQ